MGPTVDAAFGGEVDTVEVTAIAVVAGPLSDTEGVPITPESDAALVEVAEVFGGGPLSPFSMTADSLAGLPGLSALPTGVLAFVKALGIALVGGAPDVTASLTEPRLLQMCDLCDNGTLQLPANCPWCSSAVTVNGYSLYVQLLNYSAHIKDGASCVGMYTAIIDQWGDIKAAVDPLHRHLDRKCPSGLHSRDDCAAKEASSCSGKWSRGGRLRQERLEGEGQMVQEQPEPSSGTSKGES